VAVKKIIPDDADRINKHFRPCIRKHVLDARR